MWLHFCVGRCCALYMDLTTMGHGRQWCVRFSSSSPCCARELTTLLNVSFLLSCIFEKPYLVIVMDLHLACHEGVKHLPEVGWATVLPFLWPVSSCPFACWGRIVFLLIYRHTLCTKPVNPFPCLVNVFSWFVVCLLIVFMVLLSGGNLWFG